MDFSFDIFQRYKMVGYVKAFKMDACKVKKWWLVLLKM